MKNTVYIDVDTDREQPILIGKGGETEPPQTSDEAKEMILVDIGCVCEALITLMKLAEQNGYAEKEVMVLNVKKQLDIYLNGDEQHD